jgi:hypothetical protein
MQTRFEPSRHSNKYAPSACRSSLLNHDDDVWLHASIGRQENAAIPDSEEYLNSFGEVDFAIGPSVLLQWSWFSVGITDLQVVDIEK